MVTLDGGVQISEAFSMKVTSPPTLPLTKDVSRQVVLKRLLGLGGLTVGSLAVPTLALADVTNKVASSTALSNLKRANRQLSNLQKAVQDNDFLQVKETLRTPPFVDVRKNCVILIRGGEDGPKADELVSTYKKFIASVEKLDSTASLAMRGRKIPPEDMYQDYLAVESTFQDFLRVAEESATIPVQYSDTE